MLNLSELDDDALERLMIAIQQLTVKKGLKIRVRAKDVLKSELCQEIKKRRLPQVTSVCDVNVVWLNSEFGE